jgi:hypothetical protein
MNKFSTYRKSTETVEVYFFTGDNSSEIESVLTRANIQYDFKNTEIILDYKTTYYLRSFSISQDRNVYYLDKGMYLVKDNLNTISTYSELRFKKLFQEVKGYGIY